MGLFKNIVKGIGKVFGAVNGSTAANETNLQIAQMNNEYNEKMLNKQLDYNKWALNEANQFNQSERIASQNYNTSERLATQQYNSASAQRARLEAAGLNPYLMMDGGSAGTAKSQSVNGASSASPLGISTPTATPVQIQPNNWFEGLQQISGVSGIISTLIDAHAQQGVRNAMEKKTLADAEVSNISARLLGIDELSRKDLNEANLKKIMAEAASAITQNDLNQFNLRKGEKMLPIEYETALQNKSNMQETQNLIMAQANLADIQAQLAQKDLDVYDERFQASLAVMSAETSSYLASANASNKQAELFVEQKLKTALEKNQIDYTPKQLSDLKDIVIKTGRANQKKAEADAYRAEKFKDTPTNVAEAGLYGTGSVARRVGKGIVKSTKPKKLTKSEQKAAKTFQSALEGVVKVVRGKPENLPWNRNKKKK